MSEIKIEYRPINKDDLDFLEDMLYEAIFVPEGQPKYPRAIIKEPSIAQYISNWGSQTFDRAVIACVGSFAVGAIWGRIFPKKRKGYGFVDERTPEISLAVLPQFRNMGIGAKMLEKITAVYQKEGMKQLSLSVDKLNPARNLYFRNGFEIHEEQDTSLVLVKKI